jgi:CubicO group peptidase (beta-lactamase class C family)
MKKFILILLVGITSLICKPVFPQSSPNKKLAVKLDSLILSILKKMPAIPALAVALVDENGPLLMKGYGWLDKEAGIKANENSLFYIGSNTKAFTALAAVLYDREKKIRLDSSFKKYLAGTTFKNEISSNITVLDLLNHTSGLFNNPLVFRMASSGQTGKDDISSALSNETVAKNPHGVYKYDNLGYNIYGLILEEYLNKKWQDVLDERIFSPLKMQRTTAYMSLAEKNNWPIAMPYYAFGDKGLTKLEQSKKDNTMHAAGGLITSASDMAKWVQVQLNQGKVKGKQVFPEEIIRGTQTGAAGYERKEMDTVSRNKYAFGWNETQYRGEKFIWHTGGYFGYASYVSFMPGKKIGLTIMTNESGSAPLVMEALNQFVYNCVTGATDAEAVLYKRLEDIMQRHDKKLDAVQRSYADRAKRTSQLTLPLEAYVGKYSNDVYGEVEIRIENNTLGMHFGNMHSLSTPFTEKDAIRIQLQPDIGEIVSFNTDLSGKITSFVYNKLQFIKN